MPTCPYCQARPIQAARPGGDPPKHCGSPVCRLAMRRQTNAASHRAQSERRRAERQANPRPPRQRPAPPDMVAAQVEAARLARLARERATGQRTFTLGDGWAQRPGVTTITHGAIGGDWC